MFKFLRIDLEDFPEADLPCRYRQVYCCRNSPESFEHDIADRLLLSCNLIVSGRMIPGPVAQAKGSIDSYGLASHAVHDDLSKQLAGDWQDRSLGGNPPL